MDKWTDKYLAKLKNCKTDEELEIIIDLIYSDGFSDGKDDDNREPPEPLHNEGYD